MTTNQQKIQRPSILSQLNQILNSSIESEGRALVLLRFFHSFLAKAVDFEFGGIAQYQRQSLCSVVFEYNICLFFQFPWLVGSSTIDASEFRFSRQKSGSFFADTPGFLLS